MRATTSVIKGYEMVPLGLGVETVEKWRNRVLTKQRILDIALGMCTATILGTVLFSLYRGFQTATIAGF